MAKSKRQQFEDDVIGLLKSLVDAVGNLSNDNAGLKKDVSGLKKDVSGLKKDMVTVKDKLEDIETDVKFIKQDVSELKRDTGEAFYRLELVEKHQIQQDKKINQIESLQCTN